MKIEELKKLIEEGAHAVNWRFETGEFEDCWWEVTAFSSDQAYRFRLCTGESNQWAGRLIAAMRTAMPKLIAVVEAAKAACADYDLQCEDSNGTLNELTKVLTALESDT